MGIRTIGRTALAVTLAGTLLAGCGGKGTGTAAEPSPKENGVAALAPEEALKRSTAALEKAGSYRVKGGMQDDGSAITVDLAVAGTDLGGTMTMDGGKIDLLAVGGQKYLRADEKFWAKVVEPNAADDAAKLFGGKWMKVDPENKTARLFDFATPQKLLKADAPLTKGETRDVDGQPAIGLVESDSNGGTLFVATTGEPYPVMLTSGKDTQGEIRLSDFGATFDQIKAPAEADVVEMKDLKRK
ncbi:hypothetical protein [Micromonospora siamensis]|uniref:Lipoprotein n=1 Tax=Micromonospora siamensis TaxID=299152 RepID=A0A1C5HXP3_9ACTN|nr:hypothetical protein [Micromonospora siamensis]SCG50749.1 hypothetical protein GA0074704_2538 [Micromonospora siamensis]